MSTPFRPGDLFVSPTGNDKWSGTLDAPNHDRTDGPLSTIQRAQELVRSRNSRGFGSTPMTVWIRGGHYFLSKPLEFGPADSCFVTYTAYPGERPIIDGGYPISGWKETTINGKSAWVADVGVHIKKNGYFKSLFVNGRRASRTRYPKEGFLEIAEVPEEFIPHVDYHHHGAFDGTKVFGFKKGDIKPWKNLTDVDLMVLEIWIDNRMPIESADFERNLVRSTRKSSVRLKVGQRYFVENVREELNEAGQWYLDRSEGMLYYLPKQGETMAASEIIAGHQLQFMRLTGDPENGSYVHSIHFKGLTFQNTDWVQPDGNAKRYDPYIKPEKRRLYDSFEHFKSWQDHDENHANAVQASYTLPGVIYLRGVKNCSIEDCTIRNIGWYGVEMLEGCQGIRITGNTIESAGGGGIKVDSGAYKGPSQLHTRYNHLTDNHIHDCGTVFYSACGILVMHAFDTYIAHNHIHDMYYSGISVGWTWGYADLCSHNNRIEKNHIHHLGKQLLSDMGGVYLLGVQPGTVVSGNLIHDITKSEYGGWGIYLDAGSSNIVVEKNITYRTNSQSFHINFGRENIVRNNIWGYGGEGLIAITRGNALKWLENKAYDDGSVTGSISFFRNIVLTDGKPIYANGAESSCAYLKVATFYAECNLFWDISGLPIHGHDIKGWKGEIVGTHTFEQIQSYGLDLHSKVSDPKFVDPKKLELGLQDDSPAYKLGFEKIDMSDVGIRAPETREKAWTRIPTGWYIGI